MNASDDTEEPPPRAGAPTSTADRERPDRDGAFEGARLAVRNVGGIDRCDVTFPPGVTVLAGQNATNRTSLLTALADVLGGSPATLKADADAGRIELHVGDDVYVREYSREGGSFAAGGRQFTDRRDLVDLCVRLLEDNPARRAVRNGDDLREIVMEPVDTERIKRDARELERERERVEDRIEEIDGERDRLPSLRDRRSELRSELETIEGEIEEVRARIEEFDAGTERTREVEDLLDELDDLRGELEGIEERIGRHDDRIEDLRGRAEEIEAEIAEHTVPEAELETVEPELERLRERKRDLDAAIDDLQRLVEFNEAFVEDGRAGPAGLSDGRDVAAGLDPMSETVECWTCGSEVTRRDIADRLGELRDVLEERREKRREVESEIEELRERAEELRDAVTREEELRADLEEVEEEIDVREAKRADLLGEREAVLAEIESIEERIDEADDGEERDLLEAHGRLSELEYRRGRIEQELAETKEELEHIEGLAEERESLRSQRRGIEDELGSLRSKIADIEEGAVEAFNGHMDTILDVLAYENVARAWIERKVPEDGEASFDLHVVRETQDGSVYEDTVGTLSESEREVIGLVLALAANLVHEAHREVPFMLLDSLEAIDAERIATLVEYFAAYAPFLVVALLPEDAAALPEAYERVTATALTE